MPTRFCSCYPRVQAVMLSGGATLLPYIGALDVGFTLLRELVGILVPARGSLAGLLCSPGRVMLSCGGEGTRVTLSLLYYDPEGWTPPVKVVLLSSAASGL